MNPLKFMIPFNEEELPWIAEMNKRYENQIYQVFGSVASDKLGCARERHRLPDMEEQKLIKFIADARKAKTELAYTINFSCFGSATDFVNKEFKDYIQHLESMGITQVIIANPYVAKLTTKYTDMKIGISTVAGIVSVDNLKPWLEYNVNKLCPDWSINRDLKLLASLSDYITLELIVNEPCLLYCPWRRFHYNMQSHTTSKDLDKIDNFPLSECIPIKAKNPEVWIKSPFIRPEDLRIYERECGVDTFKIVGRTFPLSFVKKEVEPYLQEHYDGNFLDLVPLLQNISSKPEDFTMPYYIDNESMNGFMDKFIHDKFECDSECGKGCKYCFEWADKVVKKIKVKK